MKTRRGKIILSIAALCFSVLSAGIGMGLLAESGLTFGMRVLCGLCFMWVPVFVIAMISTMFRRTKEDTPTSAGGERNHQESDERQ